MRADMIRARMDKFVLEELGEAVATPSLEEWRRLGDPNARYGWLPPVVRDGQVIVVYQPDVLDEMTAELADEHLDSALDAIEFLIAMQVAHLHEDPDMPQDERVRLSESELYDDAGPDALAFLSLVQIGQV